MGSSDTSGQWGQWPATRQSTSFGLIVPVAEPKPGADFPHFADQLALSRMGVEAGFEGLWYADHFSFPVDGEYRGSWEVWTLMAAIAASIPNATIGPMVACTAYRNPGVIAKMTEMIQDISGGRFILGLGAGWQKDEYAQFGMPFEPRVSRFEEALEIIHALVRHGKADLQGTYTQANGAVNLPRAASGSATPILIGSTGERMLGLLARYGDAWNTGWSSDRKSLAEKVAKLDAACEVAGRDPSTVVRTINATIAADGFAGDLATVIQGDTDAKVAALRDLESLGFKQLNLRFDPLTPGAIEAFAPVIDAFHSGR